MRKYLLAVAAVIGIATASYAQAIVTPATHLGFDIVGQSAAVAQSATYLPYIDGSATPSLPLAGVTCVGATPVTCVSTFPPLSPGVHTLVITQVIQTAESSKSAPVLTFTFVVVVTPTNVRAVP